MPERGEWVSIEDLEVFKETEQLCDEIWQTVGEWNAFTRDTMGKQLVRAADSIGANLAEGDGRYHYKEKLNFDYVARGSLKETCYWIHRAQSRHLLSDERAKNFLSRLESVRRSINTLINRRRQWIAEIHEEPENYITARIDALTHYPIDPVR